MPGAVTIRVPAPTWERGKHTGKPGWLLMNHRLHHAVKAPMTRAWREAALRAAEYTITDMGVYEVPVKITITAHRTGRQIDADAIAPSAKAAIDGLVDSGLLLDDTPKHVAAVEYRAAPKAKHDYLSITLEEWK